MRNKTLLRKQFFLFLLASMVIVECSIADEATLIPTADTSVDEYNPNTPCGSYDTMRVSASWSRNGDDDMTRRAYMRFDFSSIPQGSVINYTELRLTRVETGWYPPLPGVNLCLGGISNPNWSESTLTWNNGQFTSAAPIGTLSLGTATSWVWSDNDFLTEYTREGALSYAVDKVVNHSANFPGWDTWQLRGADWGIGQDFATRENSSSLRPRLYIQFTPPENPPPPNDNFANAITMSGMSGQATGDNINAGKESGEPTHAGVASETSVWWRWTAPGTGQVTIDTNGSNFDTVLAVYTGNSVGGLTEVVSDDNGGDGAQSLVTFTNQYIDYTTHLCFAML
jgi:hypothetical protein